MVDLGWLEVEEIESLQESLILEKLELTRTMAIDADRLIQINKELESIGKYLDNLK